MKITRKCLGFCDCAESRTTSRTDTLNQSELCNEIPDCLPVTLCAESRTTSRTDKLNQSELCNEIPDCLPVTLCAESRTTSRTFDSNQNRHIEQLVEAAHSSEATKLFELFMDGY